MPPSCVSLCQLTMLRVAFSEAQSLSSGNLIKLAAEPTGKTCSYSDRKRTGLPKGRSLSGCRLALRGGSGRGCARISSSSAFLPPRSMYS